VLNDLYKLTGILHKLQVSVDTFDHENDRWNHRLPKELELQREMVYEKRKRFIDDANMVAMMKTDKAIELGQRRDGSLSALNRMRKVVRELEEVVSFYYTVIDYNLVGLRDPAAASPTYLRTMVERPRQELTDYKHASRILYNKLSHN